MRLPKRELGKSGLLLSLLGLGTVKLGRDRGVKYPSGFEIPDDRAAANLLALARERGVNLIDTAPAYGASEERLGALLKGQRQHWLICTKVGEEFDNGVSTYHFAPEQVRFSVERSLKRLGTDRLDIVLVHSNGDDERIIRELGTLEALNELKRQGKIRATGMSTKTVEGGLLAARQSDCVMVTWNLQYDNELPVIDYCRDHGVGVLIKKALASGHAALNDTPEPVLASFRMLFGHPGVTSAVVGTINPAHLEANIDACLKAIAEG
jgi:aryl-alcohol dehydrogenase-like predicted oxidoreductase